MLFLSGALQPDIAMGTPDAATVESLRDCAIETICKSKLPE